MTIVVGFDLDGTLVDSVDDITVALNAALEEVDRTPLTAAQVRRMVGHGARQLVAQALQHTDRAVGDEHRPSLRSEPHGAVQTSDDVAVDDVLARFRRQYEDALAVHTRPFEGIREALDDLRAAGLVIAVATNKPGRLARPLVEQLLPGRVAVVLGPDDVDGRLKPDPTILSMLYQKAQTTTQTASSSPRSVDDVARADRLACFVGDSAVDVETARAAGVPFLGVSWGLRPEEIHVNAASGGAVVHSPSSLAAAVLRLLSDRQPAHRLGRS